MKNIYRPSYRTFSVSLLLLLWVIGTGTAYSQTSAFAYQGRLTDLGSPADGLFDMQFKLFDSSTVGTGSQQGDTITISIVEVVNGVFAVELDFREEVFREEALFLEISIRPAGSPAPRTILSPRQALNSTPYAVRSLSALTAETATNASQLGGLPSSGFIKNTATQQAGTNFNIGGNGTLGGTLSASVVNAATRYEIAGSPVLSIEGTNNVFAGKGAGAANTSGTGNAFFGAFAGATNTSGFFNSFFGLSAGGANQIGDSNAFFGTGAGQFNTASNNSFFGALAGLANTTGNNNAFFGTNAGQANQTGVSNSFFGRNAGLLNTASDNSFFGANAGGSNQTGANNAFFGSSAGLLNTGSSNSFFGAFVGEDNTTGEFNSFFGFNAGTNNQTGNNNSFFGGNAGVLNTTGIGNSFFGRGAGAANQAGSNNSFFGNNAGVANTASNNSFFGTAAGDSNTTGAANAFFGNNAGSINDTGGGNAFFGSGAGGDNTTGSNNTIIGANADVGSGALSFATAIGAGAIVSNSNSVVLGRETDTVRIPGSLNISTLGAATATHLCINAGLVSNCSSSLRYKDQLAPFTGGLELINRLRPITFNWKQSGARDLGLVAEEVAAIEPLLVTYNERGQVEGVKYDRINIALINAIREQQEQLAKYEAQARAEREKMADKEEQIKLLQQQNRAFEARLRAIEEKFAAYKTARRRPRQSRKP